MRRHAGCLADRLAGIAGGQASLIQCMAGLVQHTHQRLGRVGLVVARGDAHVAGRAAAKRVRRAVQPRVVELQAGAGG